MQSRVPKRSLALATRFRRSIILTVVGGGDGIAVALADFQKEQRRRYFRHATASLGVIFPYGTKK
jgi:hypothetical protein